MRASYDALVIGTGFGGSVSACRLAQAGLEVGVIERGRRYPFGGFPRNWDDPLDGWLWRHEQGLFDVKPISEMFVVQSAAYGGGSQIYANVHLRVPPDGFASWPAGYTRDLLDPYYDLAATMLEVNPVQPVKYRADLPASLPPKTLLMREVAAKLGRSAQFFHPNIAVHFDDPSKEPQRNAFGALQQGCNYCGECVVGCNRQAKNTLDLNYLALAENTGKVEVALRTEVLRIEPNDSGGYRVHYRDHVRDVDGSVEAQSVFVCAGAINTTELLLRCRDEYGTLPGLSPALGHHYSGNGDYVALAFETAQPFEPSVGPIITTGMLYDRAAMDDASWFLLEEGGYPRNIASLLQLLDPRHGFERDVVAVTQHDLKRVTISASRGRVDENTGVGANSAVFLAMGRDLANGRIELVPLTNLLRIEWDVGSNMPLYSTEERLSQDVAKALGGAMGYNPFWKFLNQPISVHNLGGCVMAESPSAGVVDPDGQVHGYPNLYVMDGAALPAATGTNPSHTIAAVAERNIELFIRRYKNDPAWMAPERGKVQPVVEPMNAVQIPKDGTAPPETPGIGLTCTETMEGFLSPTSLEPQTLAEYLALADAGERLDASTQVTLTLTLQDATAFIADKKHAAVAIGELLVSGVTTTTGARVSGGVFNLFEETDSPDARKLVYTLPFYGADGQRYLLTGYKDVRDHGGFDVWGSMTTLYTLIHQGHDAHGPIVQAGVLRVHANDFARQLTTFRVVGGGSPLARAAAVARLGRLVVGTLFDVFVRPKL